MKRILYITNSTDENNTLGYRHFNIIKFLKSTFIVDLLDFAFTKKKTTFLFKVINKLFVFPDIYRLNFTSYKRQILNKIKDNHYDLVMICVLPHSFLGLATTIKKFNSKLKVVLDMTDPLSINVSYLSSWYLYRLYIKRYEEKHLQNIDKLIVLNSEIKLYYEKYYPFLKEVIVLEQGTDSFNNQKNETKHIGKKEMRLIYAGMFYRKIREPFELYKSIVNYKSSIQLSIYGSFKKLFIPPKNARIHYGGLIDKYLLNKTLLDFDVVVFLDNFYGLQIPGKIIENLETNKPILFIYKNENSPTLKYVRDFEGIFYAKNDSFEITRAICNIEEFGYKNYNRNLSKYYWETLVKNFSSSLNEIMFN
jgi:hypothetical protein